MKHTLDAIVDYLVENGMDENEVNYFLHQKIFNRRSVMEFIKNSEWDLAWTAVTAYMTGGDY